MYLLCVACCPLCISCYLLCISLCIVPFAFAPRVLFKAHEDVWQCCIVALSQERGRVRVSCSEGCLCQVWERAGWVAGKGAIAPEEPAVLSGIG